MTFENEAWDALAKRALGSERFMTDMLRANPAYARYAFLPGGVLLRVPAIETDNRPASLPPWKRAT